ncbi:ThiF family adenylyltransferase [Psychrobacter glaciei]|uniref:ThiF family adenylyltransferase n=1 Tax=Psychrobacter glaciei TaxID=619771 RepID=UPI001F068A76|nr:ThiF family adenylyltransferase [Psychrobacter glaciei]MCH1782044.1 ThiF family adenylyltransferase [Psychrobacter glaciei]
MRFSEEELLDTISCISYASNLRDLNFDKNVVSFSIDLDFEGLTEVITFDVTIDSQYPFKFSGSETIIFRNINLIEYSHVMSDGSVCFHNQHCIDFRQKLVQDFNAIKIWITKYIVKEEKDSHYEHLIVKNGAFEGSHYSYQFTDVKESFKKGEFGTVSLKSLINSPYYQSRISNYLVQSFDHSSFTVKNCDWNSHYMSANQSEQGLYVFIEDAPAINQRFSFDNWKSFESLISQDFLQYLSRYVISVRSTYNPKLPMSLFIGFHTKDKNIHWQVALINIDENIFEGSTDINGRYVYKLRNKSITWATTNNSSYSYFFGRGSFNERLTNSKILIIGVGAVGSNVAKTLTRCGCRDISLVDYDIKKPENICRSEYEFTYAYANKVDELRSLLYNISPFIDIDIIQGSLTQYIKIEAYARELAAGIETIFSNYDYIFDCSTDDDLMYILDNLNVTANIINLSITNHAESLVCGVSPNTYKFVRHQFDNILENDVEDLYNPIGCWSPTFKASYNDISTLTQFALKHINIMISNEQLNSFVINHDDNYESLKVSKF